MLLQTLNAAGVHTPFRLHAIPQEFLSHAKRARILEQIGLTPQAIALSVVEDVTALDSSMGAEGGAGRAPVDADQAH